jgi:sensor c-di-GMP phosphodiesterase-like protein
MVAGYLAARYAAVRLAQSRLDRYAARLMADGEASSEELRTVLAALGASRNRACSKDEIEYFRALIFESEYLTDVGRMQAGRIECSATLGRPAQPQSQTAPDYTQQDGTEIYTSLAPYRNNGLTVITLELNGWYVAFMPLTRMHLEAAPMHYSETAIDAPTQKPGRLQGESLHASASILSTEGLARAGDTLYATRCSIRFFNCVTAFTTIPEIVQAYRGRFLGCIALCGLFGAFAGLVFSILYRRSKSLEQQLRRAIRNERLRVVYQPVVDLRS